MSLTRQERIYLIRHLGDALYGTRGNAERRHSLGYLENHLKELVGGYPKEKRRRQEYAIRTAWDSFDKKCEEFLKTIKKEHELQDAGKPLQQWAGVTEIRWYGMRNWQSQKEFIKAVIRARGDGVKKEFLYALVDEIFRPKGG